MNHLSVFLLSPVGLSDWEVHRKHPVLPHLQLPFQDHPCPAVAVHQVPFRPSVPRPDDPPAGARYPAGEVRRTGTDNYIDNDVYKSKRLDVVKFSYWHFWKQIVNIRVVGYSFQPYHLLVWVVMNTFLKAFFMVLAICRRSLGRASLPSFCLILIKTFNNISIEF